MNVAKLNVRGASGLFAALLFAALLSLAVAGVLALNFEIIEKGEGLLPYTNGYIYDVRFFDSVNFYFERENKKPRDILNGYILGGVSFISFTFLFLLVLFSNSWVRSRPPWMFLGFSLGAMFLAVDELFGVHENIGHNLRFLAGFPFITRPDDLIITLYLVPAVAFLFYFRREIILSRDAMIAFAIGIGLFVIALVADILDASKPEEVLEVLSAASLLPGVFLLGLAHFLQTLVSIGQAR